MAAFLFHVNHIVQLRTDKEVVWVDAPWRIAAMQDVQPVVKRANMEKHRQPVRLNESFPTGTAR